ncbi:hypothetical protein Taro_015531 [Colocasia esculenta]|uniref:DYW domain-containing protein n=1 Tax=Colocasia esculenta TaxID=4460 RepID=A0A843UHL8_COLES|nr:hypothetical protein [Colocasia esculenta]
MRGLEKLPPIWAAAVASSNRAIISLSRAGDLVGACDLFDRMPHRDVVSWNSMMSAYTLHGRHEEVLWTFFHMRRHGLKPSQTTLSTVLSSCAELRSLIEGEQVHGISIKACSSSNVFVGTSLITMYYKCRVSDCLLAAFDDVNWKSTATWNALLSGFVCNQQIVEAREVFDWMPSRNVISWTAMIHGYVNAGEMLSASELFDLMPVKNLVTWAVMLGGLVSDGQFADAIALFNNMRHSGVRASSAAIMHVIAACSSLESPKQGKGIHGYVVKLGFESDQDIEASLIFMYFRCLGAEAAELEVNKFKCKSTNSCNSLIHSYLDHNKVDVAQKIFVKMKKRDETSWFLMINGYLKYNMIEDAIDLFSMMPELTVKTCTILISGFLEKGRLDTARQLFDMMHERDVMAYTTLISGYMDMGLLEDALDLFRRTPEPNVVTYNVLFSGLVRHGKVMEAYDLFNKSPVKDAISWSTMIYAFVQSGYSDEAFILFRRMISSDVSTNMSVIASILSASASLSMLTQGELIHGLAIKFGFQSCVMIVNSLINMYSKCGEALIAKSIFECMQDRDLITWNSMIYGYAVNSFSVEGIQMFEEMKTSGIKPDDVTFLGVLCACTHKCLLEEARHYFSIMKSEHGLMPRLPHYTCIIDILCRLGQLQEAENLVYSMPFEPDSAIWTSILKGCRLNCRVDLAEHAVKQLCILDPGDPSPYLHLIRIYGLTGQLSNLQRLRNEMSDAGITKRPGCSWIEINGKVNSFFAGDRSQSLSGEVFTYLKVLISKIKEIGYVPDYNLVIEEMDDQEKEEVLLQHSEKIAVAFGLLNTNYPKPVRIIKNLRTCGDCHLAMKLVSLYARREIVMRDTVRFHHFKGGSCSCSDSW